VIKTITKKYQLFQNYFGLQQLNGSYSTRTVTVGVYELVAGDKTRLWTSGAKGLSLLNACGRDTCD
jgi:hypothetical protein